jgi:AcrR family transcriptional regulator
MDTTTTSKTETLNDLSVMIAGAVDSLGDEGGDEAVTIRRVAARVGVKVHLIYAVFEHKDRLLCDAARRAEQLLDAWLSDHCMPCSSSTQRMMCMLRAYVEFARRHRWRYRLLFGGDRRPSARTEHADVNPFVLRAASMLNQGPWPYRDAEALATAWRLWMALDGLATATIRDDGDMRGRPGGLCDPDFVDRFIRMLMRGLAGPAPLDRTVEPASAVRGT